MDEHACGEHVEPVERAGPERQRWVNRSGCPTGEEVNNGSIIGDLEEIKGVGLWLLEFGSFFMVPVKCDRNDIFGHSKQIAP